MDFPKMKGHWKQPTGPMCKLSNFSRRIGGAAPKKCAQFQLSAAPKPHLDLKEVKSSGPKLGTSQVNGSM